MLIPKCLQFLCMIFLCILLNSSHMDMICCLGGNSEHSETAKTFSQTRSGHGFCKDTVWTMSNITVDSLILLHCPHWALTVSLSSSWPLGGNSHPNLQVTLVMCSRAELRVIPWEKKWRRRPIGWRSAGWWFLFLLHLIKNLTKCQVKLVCYSYLIICILKCLSFVN